MCDNISSNFNKRCFRIGSELLYNLNVTSNLQQDKIIFWNKYQIFVFDDLTVDQATLSIIPDFIIHQVALTNNYLVCLDCNGNVHTVSLKLKSNAQKRFKASFNPKENNVKYLLNCGFDYIYSIKLEFDTIFLCANKINNDFQCSKKVMLNFNDENLSTNDLMQRCIVKAQAVTDMQYPNLEQIFKTKIDKESYLLVISLDSISVYGTIANINKLSDELILTKLYKSCTKICDIQISELENLQIVIGLESGTFVIIPISKDQEMIKTVHMNVSISKFHAYKDNIFYSDGHTFWKADKILSKSDFNIKELSIKLIKDFIVIKDQIIATVYTNNIYVISLADESHILVNQDSKDLKEFYPVNDLISNSEYIHKIMALVNKNGQVLNKIQIESSYLLALGIAKNKCLRENLLEYELLIFYEFLDILKQKDILLTKNLNEYFSSNLLLVLITVIPPKSLKVIELLNKLKNEIKLHIIISTDDKSLDTTSLSIQDFSNKSNILIPVENEHYTNLNVKIKLIVNVNGGLNGSLLLPTLISEKKFVLNSEYFLKNMALNRNLTEIKKNNQSIDDLVLEFSNKVHGNLFELSEVKEKTKQQYNYYIKLPPEYKSHLKKKYCLPHLNNESRDQVLKKILTEEFLKGKTEVVWTIGDKKVKLQLVSEEAKPMLKISCEDIKIAWNIRLFFSNIFYGFNDDCQGMKMLISQAHYTVVENTQRRLRKYLEEQTMNEDTLIEISHEIQSNIVGILPL